MGKFLIVFGVLAMLVGAVKAGDGEFGDDELMQTVKDANDSLSSNLAQQNVQGSTDDVKQLQQMFARVEDHFVHKGGANDAVELARKSQGYLGDILRQVSANQFDSAVGTATDLSRVCKTCHTFYKKE